MAETLESWSSKVQKYEDYGMFRTNRFFHDPIRAVARDDNLFYSPADGIVLYQKIVNPTENILDIKGKTYSLKDLLEDPKVTADKYLVIGIFMTVYDVHINRVPYSGILSYRTCDPILSANKPMEAEEKDILADKMKDLVGPDTGYLRYNARVVNSIYVPGLDYRYWLVQIADDDVDVIAPFDPDQNIWVQQGARFSTVRWGSHVELVLPLDDRFVLDTLCTDDVHVEAGLDALVRIEAHDKRKTLYAHRPLLNWADIAGWAKEQGFLSVLTEGDMHVTLAYSKTPFDWSGVEPNGGTVAVRDGHRSVEQLGDKGAVVLRFESSYLHDRWSELKGYGASWDYPGYKPHVTITYQGGVFNLNIVEPYKGPLVFGPEVFDVISDSIDRIERKL